MHVLRWTLTAMLTIVCCALPQRSMTLAASPPAFAASPCPFPVGAGLRQGSDVRCGFVSVPERHERPYGATIKIAVAIFKGSDDVAHPDPVISLQGGPGGAWLGVLGPLINTQTAPALVGARDLVLIDQRGTGASRPSLACPGVAKEAAYQLVRDLPPARSAPLETAATRACRARLMAQGIDLGAYTTAEDAADVNAVIAALGYRRVNLYGVSYGTELALAVMRAFPERLRSVVLDSVLPPQTNFQVEALIDNAHALRAVFAGCAAQPACKAAYPTLPALLDNLVSRLNAKPVIIEVVNPLDHKPYRIPFTGDRLVDLVTQTLYVSPAIYLLPAVIHAAALGNFAPVALLYGAVGFNESVSLGMYLSVECGEDAPVTSLLALRRAASRFDAPERPGQLAESLDFLRQCAAWRVPAVDPSFRLPVKSAIPTLLLAGQYDPVTPLRNARLAASTLSHGMVVYFPGVGHGQALSGSCPLRIVQAFYAQPTVRPATGCIATMGVTFLVKG
jgi:pimeloyl-ACP methyl ester carboxylesterase